MPMRHERASTPSSRSRRQMLGALAAAGAATMVDRGSVLARLIAEQPCGDPASAGTLIETLPLSRAGAPVQPFGVKFGGSGLDARMATDLSLLEPDRLITPTDRIFLRTECPPEAAGHRGPWMIRTGGMVDPAGRGGPGTSLALDDLKSAALSKGLHLLECSGNNNPANFGMMSVAEWEGVPLAEVVTRLPRSDRATGVFVGGVDYEEGSWRDSIPGASWVFPLGSLEQLGAFLAFRVNGAPLSPDHGMPVRLVAPGWFGCAWIKWVNEIRLVGPGEPATRQMMEFAGRTHQSARHALAEDYAPAVIETAATPVRVEKRRGSGGLTYRIVGIVWGGLRRVDRLAIRFGPEEEWRPFSVCPTPGTAGIWSLWDYAWTPAAPGRYDIALRVPDPSVPQRRLDAGYYVRQVTIDEV
jgi:DMSO/TMAO reductase YedYZ molybdopterin-dependent catalytic subunit